MTLVAASIHDSQITIVSDTQISFNDDETQTRYDLLRKPSLKILVVSPTLAVGLAGDLPKDTSGLYQEIYSEPDDADRTVVNLRERSARYPESYIVASLTPKPTLWRIRNGHSISSAKSGRCIIGDTESYSLYLAREERLQNTKADDLDEAQALREIITYFINIDDGEVRRSESEKIAIRDFLGVEEGDFDRTIGGFLTEIATTPSGFRYKEHTQLTLPDRMNYQELLDEADHVKLDAYAEDPSLHRRYTLIGGPPNRRAAGFFLSESGTGIFYPDGQPWRAEEFTGMPSVEGMIQAVWDKYRQVLMGRRYPSYCVGYFFPRKMR